mmetsp:Transcript_53785/g.172426  ORF Transcript_53785/g.172426 Transcript_53785/m.172426 type:complete len:297 (-) Transcript_53785:723-1613(-)
MFVRPMARNAAWQDVKHPGREHDGHQNQLQGNAHGVMRVPALKLAADTVNGDVEGLLPRKADAYHQGLDNAVRGGGLRVVSCDADGHDEDKGECGEKQRHAHGCAHLASRSRGHQLHGHVGAHASREELVEVPEIPGGCIMAHPAGGHRYNLQDRVEVAVHSGAEVLERLGPLAHEQLEHQGAAGGCQQADDLLRGLMPRRSVQVGHLHSDAMPRHQRDEEAHDETTKFVLDVLALVAPMLCPVHIRRVCAGIHMHPHDLCQERNAEDAGSRRNDPHEAEGWPIREDGLLPQGGDQ